MLSECSTADVTPEGACTRRTDTRPIQISVADLQADAEGIIRNLAESGEAIILSADGEMIATLAPLIHYPPLTPEQVVEVKQAFTDAEKEHSSEWTDHEDFMHELEEAERNRADE